MSKMTGSDKARAGAGSGCWGSIITILQKWHPGWERGLAVEIDALVEAYGEHIREQAIRECADLPASAQPAQIGGTVGLDGDTKREELVCRRHDVYYDSQNGSCVICELRAALRQPSAQPSSEEVHDWHGRTPDGVWHGCPQHPDPLFAATQPSSSHLRDGVEALACKWHGLSEPASSKGDQMSDQLKPLHELVREWRGQGKSVGLPRQAQYAADELEAQLRAWDGALNVPEEHWFEHCKLLGIPQSIDSYWISRKLLGVPPK